MSVTNLSHRDSRVTTASRHKGCHKTPTRPDPTRPLTTAEAPSIGSVVEGRRAAGWMAADAAIGGVR